MSVWSNESLYSDNNFLFFFFFFFPNAQHGTEWASSPCSVCSCTHGEVRCTSRPCPPLLCGHQELEFIPEGSCCPVCVGPGSEYELVERDPLCLWGLPGDIPALLFLAQCGTEIPNPIPYWNRGVALHMAEAMLQRLSSIPNLRFWDSLIYYFALARCNPSVFIAPKKEREEGQDPLLWLHKAKVLIVPPASRWREERTNHFSM